MVWDTSTPAGSSARSLGDDYIREFKTDVQTALRGNASDGTEAKFPGSDTANPVFRYRGLKGTTGARPAFGQYGLYHNTTLNTIQRDSGSAWEDVATLIPSGTKMVFYQASPPTGWTAVAVNDKFLRVVTSGGTGGTTGGSVAASTSLAHTHTVDSHTHTGPSHTHSVPNHVHALDYTLSSIAGVNLTGELVSLDSDGATLATGANTGGIARRHAFLNITKSDGSTTTGSEGTGVTGGTAPGTDNGTIGAGAFAYADVCVATKD